MPSQVADFTDAERLTAALRRSGALPEGRVASARLADGRDHILSHVARLHLAYEGGEGPPTLVVKTGLPALDAKGWPGGRREVEFYTQVAGVHPGRFVPRCHEASWEEASNSWHLLLEDLAASHHVATTWPVPPDLAECEAIVRGWARMHALWWDHPQLGDTVGRWPESAVLGRSVDDLRTLTASFVEALGDRLSPQRQQLYGRFAAGADSLAARHASRRHLTIVHGDAHAWNVFLPNDGGGDVRLFDWDSWRIDAGATDIAYMLALHWYPDQRRRAERPLLDAYHAELLAHGVTGYAREDLAADYRLAVLWQLATPAYQWSYGIPPVIWWNNLERILLAAEDLGCAELLG